MTGTTWREKRSGRQRRTIRIIGRAQARQTATHPVIWKAETVDHWLPDRIGRTVYVSHRTLRGDYTETSTSEEPR